MLTINQLKAALLPFIDDDKPVVADTQQVAGIVLDFYAELENHDRNGDEDVWSTVINGRKHFAASVFEHGGLVCLGLEAA